MDPSRRLPFVREGAVMLRHPRVPHPAELVSKRTSAFNAWVTDHLALALGSVTGMYLALMVPLVAFRIALLLKILGLVSSYWIQLWALFVLQRSANMADVKRDAKADADHEALTSIHRVVDEIRRAVAVGE
jgi:hypothetical protein